MRAGFQPSPFRRGDSTRATAAPPSEETSPRPLLLYPPARAPPLWARTTTTQSGERTVGAKGTGLQAGGSLYLILGHYYVISRME